MSDLDRERLIQFFGGYFHQDWALDAADYNAVIDLYIADMPEKDALHTLAAQLDALSDAYATDADLETALLRDFYCNFAPSGTGLSARSWVRGIAERLRAASAP